MPDLGNAFINIVPKAPGIENKIGDLLGGGAEDGGKKAGSKAGSALLGTLGKVVSVAAVGKIVKDAFSAGGNLEQSFGGLETIYGDAAEGAKEYAVQAAAAGISANSYAEQAVSFGAALKQAFKGDTEKAMQAANTAIMDMADNSAKMGTDIGAIQTAYQGFAKQNYTMLDNLKLGYGGTKSEMERLLKDAQKLSGVKYDINNLGDVYDAIHVIQQDLGLTGVAAAEAETTLTGSFGAMKASWENLLAAMTTGEGLGPAMENLGKSAGNVVKNVVRMVGNIARQIPSLLTGLFQAIGPDLLPAASGIIQGLINGITTKLPELLTKGSQILQTLVRGILDAIPQLISTAGEFIPTLISGLLPMIPQMLSQGYAILQELINGILENIPDLLGTAADILAELIVGIGQNLPDIINTGLDIIGALLEGIVKFAVDLIKAGPEIFAKVKEGITKISWSDIGHDIIEGIKSGILEWAGRIADAVRSAIKGAKDEGKEEAQIGSPSRLFAEEIGRWIPAGIAVGIEDNLTPIDTAMQDMISLTSMGMQRAMKPGMTATAANRSEIDYGKLAEAISSRPVVIQGDTSKIFKVVRSQNAVRTRATNWNPLGAATT